MPVGPINAHEAVICGRLTLTLTDGEGNIKSVRQESNIINTMAKKILSSCAHNGGAGVSALYAMVASGYGTTSPSLSMTICYGSGGTPLGNFSVNPTNQPVTLTWSFMNDTQWSVNGTMTFVGYGGFSSIDAAALLWMATTSAASFSGSQWWALACFTDLAINSVDKLSFNWAFSLSTTTSTAV
jgi:hypothetical protein